MALTSRLAAAEDGLLAAINGRAALAAVPVELGDPGAGVRDEHIWIAEEATADQVSDLSSQYDPLGGREETFELNVRVMATRSGNDYEALRNRSVELVTEVETAVAEDRKLGGAVEDCEVRRIERGSGATEAGRLILTTVVVEARAWLA
jgi:hypothetical protein